MACLQESRAEAGVVAEPRTEAQRTAVRAERQRVNVRTAWTIGRVRAGSKLGRGKYSLGQLSSPMS